MANRRQGCSPDRGWNASNSPLPRRWRVKRLPRNASSARNFSMTAPSTSAGFAILAWQTTVEPWLAPFANADNNPCPTHSEMTCRRCGRGWGCLSRNSQRHWRCPFARFRRSSREGAFDTRNCCGSRWRGCWRSGASADITHRACRRPASARSAFRPLSGLACRRCAQARR